MAKTGSVKMPLKAVIRGAILPHFGKRGVLMAYFPRELKRCILRGFPVLSRNEGREKEPDLGLFSLRVRISLSKGSPTREKEGLYPHPRNHPNHLLRHPRVQDLRNNQPGH